MLVAMATLDGETPSETLLTAIHLERSEVKVKRLGEVRGRVPRKSGEEEWRGRVERNSGEEEWRGIEERKSGEEEWRGIEERNRGEEEWRGRVERKSGEGEWRGRVERESGEEEYLETFHRAGLLLASDFTHLDSDALVSLGVTATGHRKRILRLANHIQRAESQTANQRAALPRWSFEALRNTSAPNLGDLLTNCEVIVKPVPKPRTVFNRRRTAPIRFCPEGDPAPPPTRRLSQDSICLSLDSSRSSPGGMEMEMVPNEIYWGASSGSTAPAGARAHCSEQAAPPTPPRLTPDRKPERNSGSTLSNNSSGSARASTDDPEEEISPYCETVFHSRRNEGERDTRREDRHAEDHGGQKLSWTRRLSQALHPGDAQGYSTVGEPPPPLRYLSLPPHSLPSEPDDDLTISPYASYTSLTERAPPIISGWLDKLSPQGNYVFQKRYVKFDGKNLMYFGSEKDIYPKGVIPLAAIQIARPTKDHKFEIVTSHRIFVFRTDNEVLRRRWLVTLQEHVRDQMVFGQRTFGPGAQCQKHGALELKGHKNRVFAAINTEQIWIYKSEQCFLNGIGITVIEARGSTIRDGKHKSFDLITPYKTFSFTAECEREKRVWMEALQDAIAETLSDYEVAEKIWSNRSNRTCADCRALNPDWASINLSVVICKNCAGTCSGPIRSTHRPPIIYREITE
ncbi:Arf-GAP with Rho-GAP domain ANK repeat and PH domain containing protein 3 [Dissostichus eleginoides]|uniref:Arf-GAP with Rho-GAP domain ANK repeat and PH domain containing protein 3 n=1 Tax=Dissostichus eleginoides TaxID=100907 RepID=A0AAD9FIG2_DISEL|nr:Arf-GAP with Rho-GAP domain ANK repeat and PH domain containing protein 3 [Dissostichus eleginoides]